MVAALASLAMCQDYSVRSLEFGPGTHSLVPFVNRAYNVLRANECTPGPDFNVRRALPNCTTRAKRAVQTISPAAQTTPSVRDLESMELLQPKIDLFLNFAPGLIFYVETVTYAYFINFIDIANGNLS